MRILAVTSWGGACGIANYAEQCIAAVQAADPALVFTPSAEALDPHLLSPCDVVWLNYHRGLHSRWTPEVIAEVKRTLHVPVVITFHDTYGEAPPDPLVQALHDVADAFVVHEPCVGLEQQVLIRQGVPAWTGAMIYEDGPRGWTNGRPILGTVGFNFPWKLYDEIVQATAAAGWAVLIASNNATEEDEVRWRKINPYSLIVRGFRPTAELVAYLSGCDATAVMYRCANSGTSGAIRLCMAARKPLFVAPCRQWNDLKVAEQAWGVNVLREVADCTALVPALTRCPIQRMDPAVVFAAEQDSLVRQGRRYVDVFHSVLA